MLRGSAVQLGAERLRPECKLCDADSVLAEAAGADIFEIMPETPYTDADLDWRDQNSRSSVGMKDKAFRPRIAEGDAKIEEYDVIFVGFPIWWYVAPTIINTFLEGYDFAGKKIVLFATSGSSGFGNTVAELKGSVVCREKFVLC